MTSHDTPSDSDAEPRWLDSDQQDAWLALIKVVGRLPVALDRQLQAEAGLSHFEYLVMAGLSEAPQRSMRMSQLARFTEGQLPRLSQVASRLEQRGWLTRCSDPADGRSTLATLTEAGMAKVVATAPGHVEKVQQLVFDPLTRTQTAQLRDLCRKIGAQFDEPC
jgi:DNA-binding MarR family transcriptional regulator